MEQLITFCTLDTELACIKVALLGTVVKQSDVVPGTDKKFKDFIAEGVYVHSFIDEAEKFIPKISPIRLLKFSREWKQDGFDERSAISKVVASLLANDRLNFSFKDFQLFHANWEALRRLLLKSQPTTLAQYYKMVDGMNIDQLNNISFIPAEKKILELTTFFPSAKSDSTLITTQNNIPISHQNILQYIILPADSNPGFDIAIFEQDIKSKELVVLAIECRYSNPQSHTSIQLEEIKQKLKLTQKAFQPYINGKMYVVQNSLTCCVQGD